MIISRTPFRISFIGGGTDIRSYYSRNYGQVLNSTINKYIHVIVKKQIGIVEHKYRINWSKVEFKDKIDDIEHPIVREVLRKFNIDFPIEISTYADIPSNTGLGSSSAFTVGLINAIYALLGKYVSKYQIASEAANVEVDILKRNIGKQDHFSCAYGNMNVFTFMPDERVKIEPVFYKKKTIEEIENNTLLFYTAIKRDASDILDYQNKLTSDKLSNLTELRNLTPNLRDIITNGDNLDNIGKILHDGWMIKKAMSESITSIKINQYYQKAINAGALGGKLLGAGGGGFLLFYVQKDHQQKVKNALSELYLLDFKFDISGSRITYYDSNP